ncbi:DUF6263 family protein [Weeksella sp. HMSC059D05]|uniref:DUF6263 family protein n=1 Tax=Weeksella sp. HMSC059D05 TaxID=1715139 RepID=UPI0008A26CCB|nr:DUF6263 family protein [Weeksella sp. HMSC059D05]OFM83986.1 hypothetical protein HMPREF2660_10280 [Weeksella sp. HMSC059D05]
MKKFFITTAILGLSFFSCKKDSNKDDLKVVGKDANGNELVVTEQGDTIPKPTEDSLAVTSEENSVESVALIKNEDDRYDFKYNLEKGKTYPINLTVLTTRNVSDGTQSLKLSNESRKKIDYTVQDYQNGTYTLKVTFRQYSEKLTDPTGKVFSFDTSKNKPSDQMTAMSWQVYKSIIGKSYTMKMNDRGQVISVDGLGTIRSGIESSMKSSLSAEEQKALSEMLKVSLSEEAIKMQFQETMNIYPDKKLKIKESWSDENKVNEGPLKGTSKITRTLESIEEAATKISIKGTQKVSGSETQKMPTPDKKEQTVNLSMNDQSTISGNIYLDTSSGWIKKVDITQKKTVKETIESQGQKQTRTENTTVQTLVN